MVLSDKENVGHNVKLGRKIPHPASTNYDDDATRSAKRLKTFESTDGEDLASAQVSEDDGTPRVPKRFRDEIPDSDAESDPEDDRAIIMRPTELESALPPVKTDKEAIAEYEAMRADEQTEPEDLQVRLSQRKWRKGKSSIYVDAFNLALETVLEDEAHLFDEKEMEVFKQWQELEYEAQYL